MTDRMSDWLVRECTTFYERTPTEAGIYLKQLAREVQERRAADTRTPTFTDDEMADVRMCLRDYFNTSHTFMRSAGMSENLIAWVLGESPVPCQTCGGTGEVDDPGCLEAWPENHVGDYHPKCCRFPKSCSAYPLPCPTCRGEQ